MRIDSLMRDPGPSVYYDQDFRNVLEAHMTVLRQSAAEFLNVDPASAYKYEFDFFSLLAYHKVPDHLHWVVMRMNNFHSPTDNTREIASLLLPDQRVVSRILSSHRTTRKIT